VITANNSYGTFGSGVFFTISEAVLEECIVSENTGGGSFRSQGRFGFQANTTVRDCVFAGSPDGNGVRIAGSSNPSFTGCTIVLNAGYGIHAIQTDVDLVNTIVAFNDLEGIRCESNATVTAICSNIFGNQGGDWVSCVAGQGDVNGNFSADPLFCDPEAGDFHIQSDSPCAPPGATDCGLVGALPVGCGPVWVERESWARIKTRYRRGGE
jgi:hypothetical protein